MRLVIPAQPHVSTLQSLPTTAYMNLHTLYIKVNRVIIDILSWCGTVNCGKGGVVKKDWIGFFIVTALVIGGLSLIFDWRKFANFGHTSPAPKVEPVKRLRGFGPQCDWDDPIAPCTYRYVVRKGEK